MIHIPTHVIVLQLKSIGQWLGEVADLADLLVGINLAYASALATTTLAESIPARHIEDVLARQIHHLLLGVSLVYTTQRVVI